MSGNLKDILSNLSTEIDQETLLLYLQDKLPEDKKHEIEMQLLENEFEGEAMDGLNEFKDKQQVAYMVEMLNRDLKKKTAKKQERRKKLKFKEPPGIFLSIIILILLILISYLAIHQYLHK